MNSFLRKLRADQDRAREEEEKVRAEAVPAVARNKADRLKLIRAAAERHSDMFAEVAERKRLRRLDEEAVLNLGSAGDDGPPVDPVREYIREDERGRNEFGER